MSLQSIVKRGDTATQQDLIEAIVALEQREDPMTSKKARDKLEFDWFPEGVRLLEKKSVTGDLIAPPAAWVAITTFVNNWRIYNGLATDPNATQGFYKDHEDRVFLSGFIDKNGNNYAAFETVFTLPAGYRPARAQWFSVPMGGGGLQGTSILVVNTTGVVQFSANGGPGNPVNFVSLAPIHFRAEL